MYGLYEEQNAMGINGQQSFNIGPKLWVQHIYKCDLYATIHGKKSTGTQRSGIGRLLVEISTSTYKENKEQLQITYSP